MFQVIEISVIEIKFSLLNFNWKLPFLCYLSTTKTYIFNYTRVINNIDVFIELFENDTM